MADIDPDDLARAIAAHHGAAIPEDSLARAAAMLAAVIETLDAVAGGSMFDTEPAQFERVLASLAGEDT